MKNCLIGSVVMVLLSSVAMAAERPNILFAFADDWGRHASVYAGIDGPGTENDAIQTPNFDGLAKAGVLFRNAFVNAPSCTPCRSSLLSGQHFWRTGRGAILQGAIWDDAIPTWPLLLEDSGYHVGFTFKVWSPGSPRDAPIGGDANAYRQAGGKFNGFSQHASRLVQQGKTVQAAKQVLLEEVKDNFKSFLQARPGFLSAQRDEGGLGAPAGYAAGLGSSGPQLNAGA